MKKMGKEEQKTALYAHEKCEMNCEARKNGQRGAENSFICPRKMRNELRSKKKWAKKSRKQLYMPTRREKSAGKMKKMGKREKKTTLFAHM